jgi:basic amino acid/polyamine antiporter, APA family
VLYSMSRDGRGVKTATQVNTGGTPVVALFASGAVALAFLATGTFNTIIAIAAFFFVASYTLSFAAVFVLRRRDPSAARPYRAKGHPWTTGLVLLGSLGFLVSAVVADPRNSAFALGIVFVSYPVFRLSVGGGIAFEASG